MADESQQQAESLKSARTTVGRIPARGRYDREEVYRILDAGFVCHVGFSVDGQPFVIPTSYWRKGDSLYFHGSAASRMLKNLSAGAPVCVTVTHVDGLVLARSAYHHSINYRSVVVLGRAVPVLDEQEKVEALEAFVNSMVPGRWDDVRKPNPGELKATQVFKVAIREASAKIRTGPPVDEPEDLELAVWAGVIPLAESAGAAISAPDLRPGIEVPTPIANYRPRTGSSPLLSTPGREVDPLGGTRDSALE
jgi:uncharacterized protein